MASEPGGHYKVLGVDTESTGAIAAAVQVAALIAAAAWWRPSSLVLSVGRGVESSQPSRRHDACMILTRSVLLFVVAAIAEASKRLGSHPCIDRDHKELRRVPWTDVDSVGIEFRS
ncbi:MAG: hypothetical protein HOQ45_10660 [Nocardioidaceae bacterium]|nr:hypothetical protein [Nocardioidaceae bacterium]